MRRQGALYRDTDRNGAHRESIVRYQERKDKSPETSKKNSDQRIYHSYTLMSDNSHSIRDHKRQSNPMTIILIDIGDGYPTGRIPYRIDDLPRNRCMENVQKKCAYKENGCSGNTLSSNGIM